MLFLYRDGLGQTIIAHSHQFKFGSIFIRLYPDKNFPHIHFSCAVCYIISITIVRTGSDNFIVLLRGIFLYNFLRTPA